MVKLLMMWQRLRLPRHLRQLRQQQQLTKSLQTHQPPPRRPHLCLHHPQRIHKTRGANAFLPAHWRAGLLRIRVSIWHHSLEAVRMAAFCAAM
jgi:hypothetical protein